MVSKLAELIETANAKIQEAESSLKLSEASLAEAEEAKKQAELARREGVLQTAERIGIPNNWPPPRSAWPGKLQHRKTGGGTKRTRKRNRCGYGSNEHGCGRSCRQHITNSGTCR